MWIIIVRAIFWLPLNMDGEIKKAMPEHHHAHQVLFRTMPAMHDASLQKLL